MKNLSKTKILVGITVVLAITTLWFFMEKRGLEYEIILQKSIPDVELSNVQFAEGGRYYAYITGFVAFKNEADQPKDMRQYMVIEPTMSSQVYMITDILVMNLLPPREFDPVMLEVAQETDSILALVDDNGNTWTINKLTKEVQTLDSTGDATYLITSNMEFQDFMQEFLTR